MSCFAFVCFLTCSTSYILVTASWIYVMYVCMYVLCSFKSPMLLEKVT